MARKRVALASLFRQLREDIPHLLNLRALSPQFVSWLAKLHTAVATTFGNNSDEMVRLREISPELPGEFYDSIASRIEALGLNEQMTSALLMTLNKEVPEITFKQRLRDYDELISTLLLTLQARR